MVLLPQRHLLLLTTTFTALEGFSGHLEHHLAAALDRLPGETKGRVAAPAKASFASFIHRKGIDCRTAAAALSG